MQLKKLTIHNIASIEDAVIDFSGGELGNAPIFLICGETGAGKTTILDSICLALYGETPRMTSVSKEELELSDQNDSRTERYYSNDNSQLLHRGAGEGFSKLLFTGNDDKDYEAVWEVHRAHNKAHKRLLRPTRLLCSVDGEYSENRIGEIKIKIIELTGLDYEQFCRTVMLAQGEFTKFLKSNRSDKSEILEKLTGTEIYSLLGRKIAEKYNLVKNDWQKLKDEIDHVQLLYDDEVKSLEERVEEIATIEKNKSELRNRIIEKLGWLISANQYETLRQQIAKDIANLETAINSDSFKQDKNLVRDYEASGEGRAILANINKNEEEIKERRDMMPSLQKAEEEAGKIEKEAEEKSKGLEEKITALEIELEKIDVEALSKNYQSLIARDKLISDLLTAFEKLKGEEKALDILETQYQEVNKRRDENLKKADALTVPVMDAHQELVNWTEKLNKAEISVSDMVKDIRSRLNMGDKCPVCGSTIECDINDDYFESLLTPLRDSKKKAEVTYINLRLNEETARNLVSVDENELKKLGGKIKNARNNLDKTRSTTSAFKQKAGMELIDDKEADKTCLSEREKLGLEIVEVQEKQKIVESLRKEVKKLGNQLKESNGIVEKLKEKVTATKLRLKEIGAEITTLEASRDGLWENMRLFFINNPEVTMSRLNRLRDYAPGEMQLLKERIATAEEKFILEKGKLDATLSQIEEHAKSRPDFEEDDTKESLEIDKEKIDVALKMLSEEKGAIGESLGRDIKLRKEISVKQKALAEAGDELEKWEGLYNRLGDLKGVKFRAVAQSFILRSLLENANIYMKSFNDRYTLTCNPGTLAILVKDDYKPSEPQPASILSGGESFMASLSLALSLSDLRSGGMSVDILFIDEGFGTLSSEYLGNVMDTLEKLHQIGGRKVGLISHVAEMKERIPVQIRVHRESPALSKVEIVEMY